MLSATNRHCPLMSLQSHVEVSVNHFARRRVSLQLVLIETLLSNLGLHCTS